MKSVHFPVLGQTLLQILHKYEIQRVVDVTFGYGGHSRICGDKLLFAMDRDESVKEYNFTNVPLYIDRFSQLNKYLQIHDSVPQMVHADLGLSMMQIQSSRGFSFMIDSALNMNASIDGVPLSHQLRTMQKAKITSILAEYGELKSQSGPIANRIDIYRLRKDIETTYDLIEACGIKDYHLLAKIFQAFRIYVNDEENELEALMSVCNQNEIPFVSVITFHSREAKIVKRLLRMYGYKIKVFLPNSQEISENRASRSAVQYLGIRTKSAITL